MTGERTLVIGTGNEHRGDDAAGLLAARSLRTLIGHRGPAEILEHRGDGAALIELWAGRSWVILVDAVRSAGSPGQVLRFDASDRPLEAEREHGSTHAFGPAVACRGESRSTASPAACSRSAPKPSPPCASQLEPWPARSPSSSD